MKTIKRVNKNKLMKQINKRKSNENMPMKAQKNRTI